MFLITASTFFFDRELELLDKATTCRNYDNLNIKTIYFVFIESKPNTYFKLETSTLRTPAKALVIVSYFNMKNFL